MPKAERGTPKDIANRSKAKGLQKLKFYCQMCAKQCRDENGFKCHMTSDSHLRQMKIFRENSGGMLDSFSREFEVAYLETLRRRHGTQRMNANNVYQEVIQDKHHVHMNSTKWSTLTDFVQYLGKKAVCVVEETERGWYVTYIERDPTLLARQEAQRKKTEADAREEKISAQRRDNLRREAAKALDRAGCAVDRKASVIGDRDGDTKMEMKLGLMWKKADGSSKQKRKGKKKVSLLEENNKDEDDEHVKNAPSSDNRDASIQKQHVNNLVPKRELEHNNNHASDKEASAKKQKTNNRSNDKRKDYWLQRNILVRIISKKLASGEYYKRKAIVNKVVHKYEAEVEVLPNSLHTRNGGDILRIDQDDLETVIPKGLGEKVRILNGRYRGWKAQVMGLDKGRYLGELRLVEDNGDVCGNGKFVSLDYEDFSKIA